MTELSFLDLPPAAMTALLADDLATASAATGVTLTEFFATDRAKWLWRYRLGQLAEDPGGAAWIGRLVAVDPDHGAVGQGGYHGPPDAEGRVEVGYRVDPAFYRRGVATAILAELLRRAAAAPDVRIVRASVAPDNVGSLATIAKYGFVQVGEQWDDEDGLELCFEVSV